ASYLKVFSALDEMKVDNDEILSRKTKTAVSKLHLSKNYLFSSLLQSLGQFHQENLVQIGLLRTIENFHLLVSRGLTEDALRQLNKALTFAEKNELYHYQMELLDQKRKLWLQVNTSDKQVEEIQALNKQYEELLLIWENYHLYEKLLYQQAILMTPSYTILGKNLKELHMEIINHEAISGSLQPLSLRAKHYRSCIKLNFYAVAGMRAEAEKEAEELLAICKSGSYFISYDQLPLINAYNQSMTAAYFNGNFNRLGILLQELEAHKFKNQQAKVYQFLYFSLFKLVWLDQQQNREAVMELSRQTEKQMLAFLSYIRSDLFLALVTAFSSAMLEYRDYSATIHWIEVYRQNLKVKKHFDTQTTLQVFQMIAHFNKGNFDLVENILISFERFLKKNGADHFDKAIVKSFHTLLNGNFEKHIPDLLNELKVGFEQNPAGKNLNIAPLLKSFLEQFN
ncbi:MAG: hypothetical protein K1X82_15315, partial [Bacteroidia bacterium]|nr:hypothetical protein [Bacteroidia bacterium]